MAGIYLKLGTVRSLKSGLLISTAHRYESKDIGIFCLKPDKDIRDIGVIASRSGLQRPCHMLGEHEDLKRTVEIERQMLQDMEDKKLEIILIDEGQMLSEYNVKDILELSTKYSILIYGLRSDYKAQTWKPISILENFAKDIEEVKNPCEYCGSLAKLNLRLVNGVPTTQGESIIIDESLHKSDFVPVCPKCYLEKVGIPEINF